MKLVSNFKNRYYKKKIKKYSGEQIINELYNKKYSEVNKTAYLIFWYLKKGYPLSDIKSDFILSILVTLIINEKINIKLLEEYSIEELSVFNNECYRHILKKLVKAGIKSYKIIDKFNIFDFDKSDLCSLKDGELFVLCVSKKKDIFLEALSEIHIEDLISMYKIAKSKGQTDEKVTHMIMNRAYDEYKSDVILYFDPEDIHYYLVDKIIENNDNEVIAKIFDKFAPNSNSRKKLLESLIGEKQNDEGKKEANDDGEFTYKVLKTVPNLTKEEIKALNNKMKKATNEEYQMYWMYGDKTTEELKKLDESVLSRIILFFLSDKCKNKEEANRVLDKLSEIKENIAKPIPYSDAADGNYKVGIKGTFIPNSQGNGSAFKRGGRPAGKPNNLTD